MNKRLMMVSAVAVGLGVPDIAAAAGSDAGMNANSTRQQQSVTGLTTPPGAPSSTTPRAQTGLTTPSHSPSNPTVRGTSTVRQAASSQRITDQDYSASLDRLLQAAQSLREAIQAMATQPVGDRRNEAIDQARQALLETQRAMLLLPYELRMGERARDQRPSDADYSASMRELQTAAQSLRESIQRLATQPAGRNRNLAIEQANEALIETNEAMLQVLAVGPGVPGQSPARGAGSVSASGRAAGAERASTNR